MTGPVQSSGNAPFGGYVFNGPATGPAPVDFNRSPGIWQQLYNEAAIKIGLPQVKADAKFPPDGLVVRELERQNNVYHAQQRGPTAHAEKLVNEARIPGIFSDSVDTPRLAAEIVALRRDLPADAKQIENEIMNKLGAKNGGAGDQSRFADELRKAESYPASADTALGSMANADAAKQPAATRVQLNADVNAIINDATSKDTFTVKGEIFSQNITFSTERLVAQLSALAETDPAKAQLIRSELSARLTPQEAGNMNRMLAGETSVFEEVTIGLNDPGDAAIGAAKGVANDGIGILNLLARGGAAKAAVDAEQNAAMQSLFGMDKAAEQSRQTADALYKASQADIIPSIPYSNAAQQGGANIVTAAELASGVGTLAKGAYVGGKWVAKNAPELFGKGLRFIDNTLILDANKGAQFVIGNKTHRIGDAPVVTGGKAADIDGNAVTVRSPKSYDSVQPNSLGGMTYTKDGISVKYDANGFPVFGSKADVYLDVKHIKSADPQAHFKAANELLGNALKADPGLAKRMGLSEADVKHFTKEPASKDAPKDFTWHHHQDTGKMQLVSQAEHEHFRGGHLGGMSLWGGKY